MGNLKPFRLIKNHEDTEMFNTSKRNGENNNEDGNGEIRELKISTIILFRYQLDILLTKYNKEKETFIKIIISILSSFKKYCCKLINNCYKILIIILN